jgi:hypothetical protein
MSAARMTLPEASDRLFAMPGVVHGFIQHTVGMEEAAKGPGVRAVSNYRVVIYTEKKCVEDAAPDLFAAITAALARAAIQAPDWLSVAQVSAV